MLPGSLPLPVTPSATVPNFVPTTKPYQLLPSVHCVPETHCLCTLEHTWSHESTLGLGC